ncbi:TetR/AcrR family transcriptional regulator [Georgenia sp. Marseille-Q6866]
MPHTDTTPTRDKERTRAAILDAAAQMISEHGAGVSLADIAARAGVSKGALTHHFPSREELETTLLVNAAERFWDDVRAHVDLAENRPGKLLRAYIRTLTSDSAITQETFSPSSLLQVLGSRPSMGAIVASDARRWREAFAADGLEVALSLVLKHAAEGLAANSGTPYLTEDERDLARAELLRLAEPRPMPPA